jgi:Yip1 domain
MNPEMNLPPQPAVASTETAPQNFFNRLVGVWFSPGVTFAEIGRAPRVLLPVLMVMILTGLGYFVVVERIGYEKMVRKQIESAANNGFIPQDRVEETINQRVTGTAGTIGRYQGIVSAPLAALIMMLILAGLLKLFTLIVGAETTFKRLLAVTAYTSLALGIIKTVLSVIIFYIKDPDDIDMYNPIGSNLGAILVLTGAGLSKYLTALASWIDIFVIWQIALLSIGTAAVSTKLKTSTAAVFVSILFALSALVFSAFASFFG